MTEEKSLKMLQHYEALKDYMDQDYVFKRCCNYKSYDCIVILKKPATNFKCNELRSNIANRKFAKFRCNGLLTVAIYDLESKIFISCLDHCYEVPYRCISHDVSYTVGLLTTPHEYNEDKEIICSSGIHYYLSLEAALNYVNGIVQFELTDSLVCYGSNGEIVY